MKIYIYFEILQYFEGGKKENLKSIRMLGIGGYPNTP